jgi:hypothetical protein
MSVKDVDCGYDEKLSRAMKRGFFGVFYFTFAFAVAGSVFLIFGCETLEAIKSGDLRTEDVIRMASTGEAGMKDVGPSGKVRVQDTGTTGEVETTKKAGPIEIITGVFKKADNWFRDNLW